MKKLKKVIIAVMAFSLAFSFAACGKNSADDKNHSQVWYFYDQDDDVKSFFNGFEDNVNPEEIYSSLKFEANMLYGVYTVNNREKDIKRIKKELTFNETEFDNGTFSISSLPVGIYSGTEFLPDNYVDFKDIDDKEIAVLEFVAGEEFGTVPCSYEIDGNKIKYTELNQTNKQNEEFAFEVGDKVFEYEFSLCGPYLTVSDGNDSLKLTAFSFTENNKSDKTMLSGYSLENTPLIDELDYFASQDKSVINYAVKKDGSYYEKSAFKLSDDGRITVYLSDNNEKTFIKQYAYIVNCSGLPYLNSFDIILLDGEKIYYYTDSITEREARILSQEGTEIDKISEAELEEIAEKKYDLYNDLYNEFENNGINVTINRSTGEIAMDSTVLFGGDSAVVTDEGKAFLNKFIKAYTSIIYSEKYDGFISKTMVEGHIAPVDGTTYEGGMPLSEERAKNVKEYCLSSETGVDTSKLSSALETVGYSQSRPVYDSDGNIDIAASRRVSFRFIINIDN